MSNASATTVFDFKASGLTGRAFWVRQSISNLVHLPRPRYVAPNFDTNHIANSQQMA
uniref:Uncharacterized protein n=1 Tax=uncultured marine microorganism HF4000_005H07 TaxID=455506 RepID=B3T0E0_9ZZZZ|nr:hypothetical protein ALOHA_HF4000005H07ctg1g17 [uncultured marine microorganism HF4000_005H07]